MRHELLAPPRILPLSSSRAVANTTRSNVEDKAERSTEPTASASTTFPALRQVSEEVPDTPTRAGAEPARELLTEIIMEILSPGTRVISSHLQANEEAISGENDSGQEDQTHQDYPPDYSTLQPRDRPGYSGVNLGFLRLTVTMVKPQNTTPTVKLTAQKVDRP